MTYFNRLPVVFFYALCLEAAGVGRHNHMLIMEADTTYSILLLLYKPRNHCVFMIASWKHEYTCTSVQENHVQVHIKAQILLTFYQIIECLCRLSRPSEIFFISAWCKVMGLCDSTGPAGSVIKYGSFTVLYLVAIKLQQWGKGPKNAWQKMAKIHLCVHHASRQTSHHWMTGYDWIMALTCFVICQYSVARAMGINRITVMLFKSA